jgi:uncharacterized protein (DUF1778 family)
MHMANSSAQLRSDNINIRVTPETLGVIDRAARVVGKTRTDFILDTVKQAAEDTMLDQRLFHLDQASFDAFVRALDAPSVPNPRLEELLSRKPVWQA